jgi:hypothetical protein
MAGVLAFFAVFYLFAVLGGIWCLMWPLVRPSMQVRVGESCRVAQLNPVVYVGDIPDSAHCLIVL